ncbi:alpha/beta fold hydrolase [Rhodobacter ferrooxidans]|uniref:Alpha/beta hydrolase fold protein n=1 Tax=Rhodobacter ferrooxidans TaxID=371731 RepID=C8S0B6_9RHOB|nr:alpha/beta hydrolase [Rhodobacter sp. SW2]EEW25725.1 alpha/beta hydrolase fold protein [Rhodobacter sp. SW2]
MKAAPYFAEIAEGPEDGRTFWLTTADEVRLRAGLWHGNGPRGTVILLPGRTEYIEKYGRIARDLAASGYATLTFDCRGQGLADRLLADPMAGHVQDFAEYQRDLDALLTAADAQGLPEPRYLLSHSMGGCIALRGLMRGIKVQAAAFSAPMWGISIAAWMRPFASVFSTMSVWFNQAHRYAPGTGGKTYLAEAEFAGNILTKDSETWDYMKRQALTHPELTLGGPSMGWLHAALMECHALSMMPSPPVAAYCALGTSERVVDTGPVHLRMAAWPRGRLDLIPGSEHEVMMEVPVTRSRFIASAVALFEANR